MGVYQRPLRPDELYHWGIEKGKEAKTHKYFNRIQTGVKNGQNIYRYFYDKAAWDAYNNGKKEVKKVVNQTTKNFSNLIAKSPAKNLVESGKNLFNNFFKSKEEKEAEAKAAHDAEVRAADKTVAREEEKRHDPHQRSKADNSRRTEEYKAGKEKLDQYKKEQEELRKYREEKEKEREKNAAALTKREEAIEKARQKRLEAKIETDPKGEKKYKYLARINNPNGKGYLYFYSESTYKQWLERNGGDEEELAKTFGLKKNAMSEEEDMAEVNEKENNNTCWSCSLSYELRRRGYDVEAIDTNTGELEDNILSAFKEYGDSSHYWDERKKAEAKACEATKEFNMNGDKDVASKVFANEKNRAKMAENYIKVMERSYPEGSRGMFIIQWYAGGGHAVNWEIKNGKLMIRECQRNYTATGEDAVKYLQRCSGEYNSDLKDYGLYCHAYRTDDLTVNEDIIKTNPNGYKINKNHSMVNKN